jgi:antitoxin MazE
VDKDAIRIYIVYSMERHMKVKVAKWGNSLGVRVPRAAAEAAGLKDGTEVDVLVDGPELRIRRSIPLTHYRLEDLIAEIKRLGPDSIPETVGWGPDVGSEVIEDAYSRGEITLNDILKKKNASRDR